MKWLRRVALVLVLVFIGIAAFVSWPVTPAPQATATPKAQQAVAPQVTASASVFEKVVDAVTSSSIKGVVTLAGEPVENVQVELLERKVTTSSTGEFVFEDVPRKRAMVVTAVQGDRVARAQVIVNGGKQFPLPLTLALVPGHRVTGRVLGPREERIAGATVECADLVKHPKSFSMMRRGTVLTFGSGGVEMGPLEVIATSAEDGTYEQRLAPGRWRCSALKPGFSATGVDLDVAGDQEVDHRLGDELTLTGDVSTSDGALVTDGRVEVRQSASAAHWLTLPRSQLDAQGRFSLRGLAAGEYDFDVWAKDRMETLHQAVPPTSVHWTLPAETILSVVVVGASPGDMVMIQQPDSPGSWTGSGLQNGKTDFKRLKPGSYRLRLNQNSVDRQDQVTKEVQVVEGKTTLVELEAKATLRVSGVVVGPDGKGVVTEVELRKPSGSPGRFRDLVLPNRTDAEGRFTVDIVRGATMLLDVKPVAGLLAPEPLEVKSTDDKLIIRLTKSPVLRGQVVDGKGQPIERFTIDGEERMDREGRFELPFAVRSRSFSNGVTRISMRFSVQADGFAALTREVEQPTVDLDLGRIVLEQRRTVVLVVRSDKGKPLSGALVLRADAPMPSFLRDSDRTDVDGRLTVTNLPMTETTLVVSHPTSATTTVTVQARQTQIEATLAAGLTVSGSVTGAPRVVVALQGRVIEVTPVEKGAFTFRTLSPGVWRLGALDLSMDFANAIRAQLPERLPKDGTVEVTVGSNGLTGVVLPSSLQ